MKPAFLDGARGRLHLSVYIPEGGSIPSQWVLHCPAFAEEMNKCRPMVSRQARDFTKNGLAVVVPDLFGTGDSAGDFSEGTWSGWRQDMELVLSWIKHQGAKDVILWGVRSGCLMALSLASQFPQASKLLLWQPVWSGKQMLTQFLRLRQVASMMQEHQESVLEMRNRFSMGESLEVAGYTISPQLGEDLDSIEVAEMRLPEYSRVYVFEVVSEEGRPPTLLSQKQVDLWISQGLIVTATAVVGAPFWSTQELSWVDKLIQESSESIRTDGHSVLSDGQLSLPKIAFGEVTECFACEGEELIGVLHKGKPTVNRGVLLVVGGPQYRVGSHRQFVLLARKLAKAGIPVYRFDYRGMGDSSGTYSGYLDVNADIAAAIDSFNNLVPEISEVVIWGLCDAATAACFYAPKDSRVVGLVLLNPWVRSDAGEARAYLKHYYRQRLFNKEFWMKAFSGHLDFKKATIGFAANIHSLASRKHVETNTGSEDSHTTLAGRMEYCLREFDGGVLIIISGNDLTASEFSDTVKASNGFSTLLTQSRFSIKKLSDSDHTFSRSIWREQVADWTIQWIMSY